MTISASQTTTSVQLPCNGITTSFAFQNKIFSVSDLTVTLIDTLGNLYPFTQNGTNSFVNVATGFTYQVNNVDVDAGSQVQFNGTAPMNGWTVDIRSNVPQQQTTSIKNQGSFLPELHEEFFDRATRMLQDLKRLAYTFGIHGPDNESTAWPALPNAAGRANLAVVFGPTGLPSVGGIPTVGLFSGTASGFVPASGGSVLNFLGADGTWKRPFQKIPKNANESETRIVPANDASLAYAITAAGNYDIECLVRLGADATAAANGLNYGLNFTAGVGAGSGFVAFGVINAAAYASGQLAISGSPSAGSASVATLAASTSSDWLLLKGTVNATAAGTLGFCWAQKTGPAGNTSVLAGSLLTVTQVA